MQAFLTWLGPILAICVGIAVLAIFFALLAAVQGRGVRLKTYSIKGFLNATDRITVQLNRGEKLEDVRFLGVTDPPSAKGRVPYQLAHMVILESRTQEQILVRADAVRVIRKAQTGGGSGRGSSALAGA